MMYIRNKLLRLLGYCPCVDSNEQKAVGSCPDRKYGMCNQVSRLSYCSLQHLADHLLTNGVTLPTRCAECQDWNNGKCDNPLGLPNPYPDSFCSFGKKK